MPERTDRRQFLARLGAAVSASGLGAWSADKGHAADSVTANGDSLPGLAAFDTLMERFFDENQPLGASLAVAYQGRLVYAKGFGYADLARKQHVQPTSLFRIASLSKPITAAAVMKLVEAEKVQLDQPIVPLLALDFLEDDPQSWADPRLADITVRHCLQHTGGFDKQASGDPLALSHQIRDALDVTFPLSQDNLLQFALTRKLDFDPGHQYAYANIGYLMLGRLIEQLSGQTYQAYVQQEILHPLGIRSMQLARTLKEDAAPAEVQYRDAKGRTGPNVLGLESEDPVPFPYGIERIENVSSAGGWLASAVEVTRFASGLFFPQGKPLLNKQSQEQMFAKPHISGATPDWNGAYYGCGWLVRPVQGKLLPWTCWHTGQLAGVSSLLVARADGVCFTVLFNQDFNPEGQTMSVTIDPLLHAPASGVGRWPAGDLFTRYL
ncbi:serine hydrolase domain-containing protein [Bremerella alba]|uniref:D-aminopeptidase n=1 Tax=Bremerella alba TaxID=980252 RepID=A0A7V8VAH6_9BACT|nr:serine hydrolase domain-containing protein [Bremerella alba]MBA2117974.1 D-aminopeptidase [Bremerella alba]